MSAGPIFITPLQVSSCRFLVYKNRIFHKKRGYSHIYSHLPLACQAETGPDVFLHVCNLLLLMSVTVFTTGNG